jgi:hypothetical protein
MLLKGQILELTLNTYTSFWSKPVTRPVQLQRGGEIVFITLWKKLQCHIAEKCGQKAQLIEGQKSNNLLLCPR